MKLIPEPDFPELKRHPESGVWYVVKEVKGKKPLYKSTKERRSKTRAVRIARLILAEYLCLTPGQSKVTYLFENIALKVLELKQNRAKRTKRSAHDHIMHKLMPFFRGYPIDSIDEEKWEQYIAVNSDRKLFNDRKQMNTIMKYAFERGFIKRRIKIRNPDQKSSVGKKYEDDEIEALLSAARENPDLTLQIKFGYMEGMRKEEILYLPWHFFEWEKRMIVLPAWFTKTRKARRVPIHGALYEIIWHRFLNTDSPFVFPSPEDDQCPVTTNKTAWQNCKKAAGVTGRFHDLRHTFMSNMIHRFKVSTENAAKISGMSLQVAFEIYCHPTDSDLHRDVNLIQGIPGSGIGEHNNVATLQ